MTKNDQNTPYAEVLRRIHIICTKPDADKKLAVFRGLRKDTGEEAWLLGYVSDLKDGVPQEESSFNMLAEFLPNKPIDEIYDLQDFFIADIVNVEVKEESKGPPLPDNVRPFRKKR